MVTIKDIAEAAGVSRGTVDRVLHNRGRVAAEKEKKIREIAEAMGYEPNLAGRGLAARKKHLRIGFCYLDTNTTPFHRAVYAGAKEYAKELEQYGVEVVFFPLTDLTLSADEWQGLLEKAIGGQRMDGWAVVGLLAKTLEQLLKKRGEDKVPIVIYNMDEPCDWRLAYVGCDYLQSGRVACGVAALLTDGRGQICIASFDNGDIPSSAVRIRGFEEEMRERYPEMRIAGKEFTDASADVSKLFSKLRELARSNEDIDVLYLVNPGDYSICREISKIGAKHRIKIITNDLVTEEQQEMVREGDIAVTICQEPEKQGAKPLEILFEYLALGKQPEMDWYKTELSVRIGQNV